MGARRRRRCYQELNPKPSGSPMGLRQHYFFDSSKGTHVDLDRLGQLNLAFRPYKFFSATVTAHALDLKEVIENENSGWDSPTSDVLLIVDRGPDYNLGSLLTFSAFGELFIVLGLSTLTLTCFAASNSAFNPIERIWSQVGRKFS